MSKHVNITAEGKSYKVLKGNTAEAFFKKHTSFDVPVMACIFKGELRELTYKLEESGDLQPVLLNSEDGVRIYTRTLRMVLLKAAQEVYPNYKLDVLHSISKGYYCEFEGHSCSSEKLKDLASKMKAIIDSDLPILRKVVPKDEAIKIYEQHNYPDKIKILQYREDEKVTFYQCGNTVGYFYGYMTPSTAYVPLFELKYHHPGFILRYPLKEDPFNLPSFIKQPKLSALFMEYERWVKILGVKDAGALNEAVEDGKISDLIRVAEALHEKKISQLADIIALNKGVKAIFIAGPSSSGKTTFTQRLMVQLRVNGIFPVAISLDDYFLDRELSPVDEEGNLDYDSIEALDLGLFNDHLSRLLKGEEIELPAYNFHTGKREYKGKKLKIEEGHVMLIEGIHGLNERLSAVVPREHKFKIYVSALMQLNIDTLTPIKTTDTRLIRRIVRDFQFRGTSALDTLKRWPLVRRGEEKYIFPFQEEADAMFNTALVYELTVLKPFVEPLLEKIPVNSPEYLQARRLLKILQYIKSFHTEDIPTNSLLKEFLGGCCFYL